MTWTEVIFLCLSTLRIDKGVVDRRTPSSFWFFSAADKLQLFGFFFYTETVKCVVQFILE